MKTEFDKNLSLPQKILVFQQNWSGESKIEGVREYGCGQFIIRIFNIDYPLPKVIDNSREHLPPDIDADIVLDFLKHPDLSYDLSLFCAEKGIPHIASGKKYKNKNSSTPPTWCGLSVRPGAGKYEKLFGAPEFEVTTENGLVSEVEVLRGAPCGATRKAAERVIGLSAEEAVSRIGLEVQFLCSANPANWDPVYGKSPLHFAGDIHSKAFSLALKK